MIYIRNLTAAFFVSLSTSAGAACFDSPTWQGQPVTEDYVEQLEPTEGLRQAHLKVLRLASRSAEERQRQLRRHLISAAVLQYDGNRGELRKALLNGTMLDIVQSIDVSRLNSLNRARVIEIYWLNGCTLEVFNFLEKGGSRWTSHKYLPIASGNAPLISSLALTEALEGNDYQRKRLQAFGSLIESPKTAAATLREFLDYVVTAADGRPKKDLIDFAGLTLALSLAKGESPQFEPPTLPLNPSQLDVQIYSETWASIAAWASVSGHCMQVENLTLELLALPNEALPQNRSFLEAVAVRCFTLQDE